MLAPTAAIMIIADNADSESILAAPRAGAQGYLMSTTPPRLALQAASVVLNGGTYFPARPAHKAIIAGETVPASSISPALELDFGTSVLLKERAPVGEPRRRTSNTERILSEVRHGDELAFHHTGFTATLAPPTNESAIAHSTADAPDFHDWSSKQCAILECLCQGDPNKVIGRKLDMPESTVKVHVREIMRKLGVCNRTQAAIAVSRIRNGCEIHFDNNPITAARHRPSG
jgi:DNA-binding NarL/FixJ family response regulator